MSNHSKHIPGTSRAKKAAVLSGGALVAASPFVVSGQVDAATFNVTTLADSGAGSLRAALDLANANPDVDTITFQSGLTGTITLAGQLQVLESVTIQGPGAGSVTVDADGTGMAFYVYHSGGENIDVTISGITITGGTASGIVNWGENLTLDGVVLTGNTTSGNGGGLYSTSGSADNGVPYLTIKNSTISGNSAGNGGGVYHGDSVGTLLISDSIISGNTATDDGGGVYTADPKDLADTVDVKIERTTFSGNDTGAEGGGINFGDPDGQVEIIDSTFSGNSAAHGGGIYFYDTDNSGSLRIEGTTISANTASAEGGGIYLYHLDTETVISNSTITGNTATAEGGGIYGFDVEYGLTIEHSTITGNSSSNDGGGVYFYYSGSQVTLDHSIVTGNTAAGNYDDAAAYDGNIAGSWSIVGDWDGSGTNMLIGADPNLGALADNGGETQTMLPLAGSAAIDAGDPAFAGPPSTDQRGLSRVVAGRIDIGAVEVQAPVLPPTGGSNGLMAGMGAALLGLGGALHLSSKRRRRSA